MDPSEWEKLRLDRDAPRVPRPDLSGSGSPAFVGRVTTTGTTAANHYVKVNPVLVTGTETEGGSGTLTVDTSTTVFVLFLGPGTTTVGDDLVVKWGDYRWVSTKKAASGGTTVTCGPYTIPDKVLNIDWYYTNDSNGTSVNHGTMSHTAGICTWTRLVGSFFSDSQTKSNQGLCGGFDIVTGTQTAVLGYSAGVLSLGRHWTCASGGSMSYSVTAATASTFTTSPFRITWTSGLHINDVMFDIFE